MGTRRDPPDLRPGLHQIVIVGGGAGGLELATRLGDTLGKRGRVAVTLIDKTRAPCLEAKAARNRCRQHGYRRP
jgi:NADH dehydrogenase FAD-containing subunit